MRDSSLDIALCCKASPPLLEIFVRRHCNRELSGQSHHTWWLCCNNNSSTAHLTPEHPHLLPFTEKPRPRPAFHKSYSQAAHTITRKKLMQHKCILIVYICIIFKWNYSPAAVQMSKALDYVWGSRANLPACVFARVCLWLQESKTTEHRVLRTTTLSVQLPTGYKQECKLQ